LKRSKLTHTRRTIFDWTITHFVTAIVAVTSILFVTFLILAINQIKTVTSEQNVIVLKAVLDRTESFLDQTTNGMRELGSVLGELSENDEETLARIIDGVRIGSINLRSIDVIGPDARILYSSPNSSVSIGNDVSGRDAYQRVVSEGTPAWSRVFYADFLDDVVITFYVPAGGNVLAGNLSLRRLWDSMENIDVSDQTRLSIIDSNGAYVYHSDLAKVEGRMFEPNRRELRDAAGTGVPIVQHTDTGEKIHTQVENISGTNWLVAVHQGEEIQRRAQNELILAALIVLAVTLVIGVLNIRRVARRNLEPFSRLQSIALRVADGDYSVEYPESRFVEITTLSESFRSMVAGITQREISLRDARDQAERASQAKSELLPVDQQYTPRYRREDRRGATRSDRI
jgi:HAMP domain-containing protein